MGSTFQIDDDGNTGEIQSNFEALDTNNLNMEELTGIRLVKPEVTEEEYKRECPVAGFSYENNQALFHNLDKLIETYDQYTYHQIMIRVSGYLVPRQKFYLIRKYERANVYVQYKFKEYNNKVLDDNYEKYMRARLDPNTSVFGANNNKLAQEAAFERERYNDMVQGYEIAKKAAENAATVVKEDYRNPKGNLINAKAKNLVVEYKNGEVIRYDSGLEDIRMSKYKQNLNQLNNAQPGDINYYNTQDLESSDEWE